MDCNYSFNCRAAPQNVLLIIIHHIRRLMRAGFVCIRKGGYELDTTNWCLITHQRMALFGPHIVIGPTIRPFSTVVSANLCVEQCHVMNMRKHVYRITYAHADNAESQMHSTKYAHPKWQRRSHCWRRRLLLKDLFSGQAHFESCVIVYVPELHVTIRTHVYPLHFLCQATRQSFDST